jgi:hypothetical protein
MTRRRSSRSHQARRRPPASATDARGRSAERLARLLTERRRCMRATRFDLRAATQEQPAAPTHRLRRTPARSPGSQRSAGESGRSLDHHRCPGRHGEDPLGPGRRRAAIGARNLRGRRLLRAAGLGSGVAFLAQAIADAMDIKLLGSEDAERQLLRQLSGRSLLLVLDNFEHLLSGGGLVSELLAHAPDLKVLVTSRERLNAQEEWLYQLWGMGVPTEDLDVDGMREFSAIDLFERCAKKANPKFDLGRSGHDVVRICRHLQGMPLGIELAAAWVTTIPCKDIADEIEKDLGFLETRARPSPTGIEASRPSSSTPGIRPAKPYERPSRSCPSSEAASRGEQPSRLRGRRYRSSRLWRRWRSSA